MGKKLINLKDVLKVVYGLLVIAVMIFLVVQNIDSFISTTQRLKEVFNIKEVKCFFELKIDNSNIVYEEVVGEVTDTIKDTISSVTESVEQSQDKEKLLEKLKILGTNLLDFLYEFMIYFANIGLNIVIILFIYFHETFSATKEEIKRTKAANIYLLIVGTVSKVLHLILGILKRVLKLLKKNKQYIALTILCLLLANGFIYKILIELIIFMAIYIYKTIIQETYLLLFDLFKYIVITLYPLLKQVPLWTLLPLLLILLFYKAKSKGEYRLFKNHQRIKAVVKDNLTQTTFINGPPGSGKTLLNVSLSLASEEMYIEELESIMLEYELKYPYLNFAMIRKYPDKYKEHQIYTQAYSYLKDRGTYVISNYSIYSPYFKEFSKIFDFDFMRKNKQNERYALEEYNIISISELDKEYNSHDDMKRVGEEGAATFFSTVSHDLKRHTKVFCDYQLKDQVPLRIRGNSEYFYTISERKKKYPFLLGLYYAPIRFLSKRVRKLILKYETKRPFITKKTKRKTVSVYKRNDYSMLYCILRQSAAILNKISDFFDHYWYFRIKGTLAMQDGAKGEEKNICLNICDLSIENMALYDSTFLSYAYEQKKNMAFKDLRKFTSLRPSIEELTVCNSHFYNVLNGIEKEEKEEVKNNKEKKKEEEFIVIKN